MMLNFGYRNYIVREKPRRRPRKPDPKRWANRPEHITAVAVGWTVFAAVIWLPILVYLLR